MILRRALSVVLLLALLSGGHPGTPPVAAGPPGRVLPSWVEVPERVYFPQTGHHLAEPFLFYWRANGARTVFGLPISEALSTAGGMTTQYFERAVLEYRPDSGGATVLAVGQGAATTTAVNLRTGPGTQWGKVAELRRETRVRLVGGPLPDGQGAPWYQIAGPFGTGWSKGEYLERSADPIRVATLTVPPDSPRRREPAFRPLASPVLGALGPDSDELTVFPTTGHTLAPPFKRFWEARGGVLLFGLPLSQPFDEISPDDGQVYLVQYFEHAKLEYHPELAGSKDDVQLAALGRLAAAAAQVPTGPVRRVAGTHDFAEDLFRGPQWIEVDLAEQRMTAWDGDMPELSTLIRSGKRATPTPTGTFRVFAKLPKDDMTLGNPGEEDYYYTRDVPWVMYFFAGGYAIHGAFWDDGWGTPTSHGCINTPPEMAAAFYQWAPLGTLVWVHR